MDILKDTPYELVSALHALLLLESQAAAFKETLESILRQFEVLTDDICRLMVWLLEVLFWTLPSLGKFYEFAHRHRLPCTTMPWHIWPALIVLWGVCWMFHYPSTSNEPDVLGTQDLIWPPNVTFDSYDDFDWDVQLLLMPFPQGTCLDHLQPEFGVPSHQDIHAVPNSESHPTYFDNSGNANNDLYSGFAGVSQNGPSVVSNYTTLSAYAQGSDSTSHRAGVGYELGTAVEPLTQLASEAHDSGATLSSIATLPQVVNQDQQENITCVVPNCKSCAFNQFSELSQHMESHHKCTVQGCKSSTTFTSKGQLDRHKSSTHGIGGKGPYYCDYPKCKRGLAAGWKGFARVDHLIQHAKIHSKGTPCEASREDAEAFTGMGDFAARFLRRSLPIRMAIPTSTNGTKQRADDMTLAVRSSPELTQNTEATDHSVHLQLNHGGSSVDSIPTLFPPTQAGLQAAERPSIHKRRRIPEAESDEEIFETTTTAKRSKPGCDACLTKIRELEAKVARLNEVVENQNGIIENLARALGQRTK